MIQRSAGSACLGERVSGLADGSLADDVRDRALAHVAGCNACRQALDVERLLVDRLRELPAPAPSDPLLGRLLALGEPGDPLPPRAGRVAGTPRQPDAVLVGLSPGQASAGTRPPGSSRPSGRREHRRSRRVLVAAAGVLGVGVIAVTALGSALPSPGPAIVPPVGQLTVQRAGTGGGQFKNAGLENLANPAPTIVPTWAAADALTTGWMTHAAGPVRHAACWLTPLR